MKLIRRSILAKAIYEVWGRGSSYEELYKDVRATSRHLWPSYKNSSFKFTMDAFQGSRTLADQRKLFESFGFLGLEGPIKMKGVDYEFCLSEEWKLDCAALGITEPIAVHLGRYLGGSERDIIKQYDLKKRKYISTTSMDAELALVTANIMLAAPGKLIYDPFVGTGSFTVACSHFGALTFGSDIDGRSIRGKGDTDLYSNFVQYGLTSCFGDSFIADLTNTPLRASRIFDGIVCDPPYGVREGLKVLGNKDPNKTKEPVLSEGTSIPRHLYMPTALNVIEPDIYTDKKTTSRPSDHIAFYPCLMTSWHFRRGS